MPDCFSDCRFSFDPCDRRVSGILYLVVAFGLGEVLEEFCLASFLLVVVGLDDELVPYLGSCFLVVIGLYDVLDVLLLDELELFVEDVVLWLGLISVGHVYSKLE